MNRRLPLVAAGLVAAVAASAVLLAGAAGASSTHPAAGPVRAATFTGYWMGVDPLDGGDSRRGITAGRHGQFAIVGRDTVLSLCDGTDHGLITGTGRIHGRALVSRDVVLRCFNNNSSVHLVVRYAPIAGNTVRETVTSPAGAPVDKIILFRISRPS
jgi:hypothetical protein